MTLERETVSEGDVAPLRVSVIVLVGEENTNPPSAVSGASGNDTVFPAVSVQPIAIDPLSHVPATPME